MRNNKYIDISNIKAINHFLELGASLTVGNRFNKYLVENDLKL